MPAEAQVMAALLRQGRILDGLSGALLVAGVVFGFGQLLVEHADPLLAAICLALVLVGLVQKYLALRVAFDAELFARLETLGLDELDAGLLGLGLLPPQRAGRPLAERCRGALRLLKRQALCVATQGLLALGGILHALLAALAG
ncbi:hypothetical protein ACFPTX_20285 [Pseudomonas sp. GCM10022188]|uniref:hypothetical protein n=1 Tax=Pseudomonas TaxID=286 RepID=UPI001E371C59|nr:hypothetical protein [Pseudomonas oryzagri]MCC6074048.1 hypothetical protein [Pseudomonas oryzagri]